MEIPLRGGRVAIIDEDDYELISAYKWRFNEKLGYALTSVFGERGWTTVYMHRLINQTPDGVLTDHIDRDGLNNRKANLRNASFSQNALNTGVRANNSSGFRGVSRNRHRWRATLFVGGVREHLGTFADALEASQAYEKRRAEVDPA